jgi:hypothetical protein
VAWRRQRAFHLHHSDPHYRQANWPGSLISDLRHWSGGTAGMISAQYVGGRVTPSTGRTLDPATTHLGSAPTRMAGQDSHDLLGPGLRSFLAAACGTGPP